MNTQTTNNITGYTSLSVVGKDGDRRYYPQARVNGIVGGMLHIEAATKVSDDGTVTRWDGHAFYIHEVAELHTDTDPDNDDESGTVWNAMCSGLPV